MKNTIIYIDGGNLYYGQLRGSANKWLDLEAFSAKLLNPDHAIAAVKYFTSRVIDKSADQCHTQRQSQYLTALATRPLVADGRIKVRRITEKMTDVNIADAMLRDAYERRTECLVLISGDTDLAPIVKTVRYHVGIPVLVFNPQRSICNELRRYATFYRNIPQGSADGCRLPDSFETSDGRTIRCPAAWMPGRTGDS